MKLKKAHIKWIITIIILVALVATGVYFAKEFFFSNDASVIYGSRLEGIEKVPITEERKNQIKDVFKEKTTKVDVRLAGRIIYIDAEVAEGVSTQDVRALGDAALAVLSEEERAFYDVQVMASSATDTEHYPIIGYKHHAKSGYSWTKDR